jgi:YlmC/YmxH family sporulation protein
VVEKALELVMTFVDLKQKEVINCNDCMRIGCVADIDFNPESGQICGFIVPASTGLFSFGKCIKYYIRFCDVVRIGPDIMLVDVCLDKAVMKEDECRV